MTNNKNNSKTKQSTIWEALKKDNNSNNDYDKERKCYDFTQYSEFNNLSIDKDYTDKDLQKYEIKKNKIYCNGKELEIVDEDFDLSKDEQFIKCTNQLKEKFALYQMKEDIKKELSIEFDNQFKELKKDLAKNYNNYIVKFKDNYVKEMEEKYNNLHDEIVSDTDIINHAIKYYTSSNIKGTIDINESNKNIVHNNLKKNFNSYKLDNRLKDLIYQYGITKTELSEALGISRATLNNIIDNSVNVTLETAYKISKIFGMSIDDIFFYDIKEC